MGVAESINLTLKKRTGLVKKSIYEIVSVIQDFRSAVIGGIKTGILLWESVVIPYLLHNSSSWLKIKQNDLDSLIKLQNLFLNHLLGVQNCPALMMMWDLGVLPMPLRLLKEKLLLYFHICSLPASSIAHQVLLQQELLHLPSLRDEVKEFLHRYEVADVTSFTKAKWKVFVKDKIHEMGREYLLEGMRRYKKVDTLELSLEEYQMKDYFLTMTLEFSRLTFRSRSLTMNTCRMHYRNSQRNISDAFVCFSCKSSKPGHPKIDQLSHWVICPRYSQFHNSLSVIKSDVELCELYKKVINYSRENEE